MSRAETHVQTLAADTSDSRLARHGQKMGCCESLMRAVLGGSSGGGKAEVELGGASKNSPTLSETMKGADIILQQSSGRPATLSGSGLALGCAPVEQDSAYWEATVTTLPPGGTVSLGVSRRPPPDDTSGELLSGSKLGDGEKTWGFCTSDGGAAGTLKEGDVIGIALDFTDLPMLFFTRGGEPLGEGDELAVMRIRGTVYPAFGVGGGAALSVAFAGDSLAHTPPRKCEALIVGQDMI